MAKAEPKQEVAKVTALPTGIQTITDEELIRQINEVGPAGLSDSVEDRGTPLLYVAQKGSPQVDERDAKFVPNLKVGMAFNHLTGEMYDAEHEGVPFLPCFVRVVWAEWTPRNQGGGYHGEHHRNMNMEALKAKPFVTQRGKVRRDIFVLPDGHELKLTHKYYGVIETTWTPIIIPMASTSLGASTRVQNLITAQKAHIGDRIQIIPGFWNVFELKTTYESNEDGNWFQWSAKVLKPNPPGPLREFCHQFALACAKNEIKEAAPLDEGGGAPADGDVPI